MQIYIVNPKIQYNYRNINCNPDLLMAILLLLMVNFCCNGVK